MMDYNGYSYVQIIEKDQNPLSAGRAKSLSKSMRKDKKIKHFCQDASCPDGKKKMRSIDEMIYIDGLLFCMVCGKKRMITKPQILEI